jgi:aldehyde dehydrogenase (NAD+)
MAAVPNMPAAAAPEARLRFAGKSLDKGSGGVYEHVSPITGKVQAQVPLAGAKEVNEAVEAAATAFESWRFWKPAARRDVLLKLGQLIKQNANEFARLAAVDGGTPVMLGQAGVAIAEEWTSYYAGWADKIDGTVTSQYGADGEFSYATYEPLGVVGIIITWNGPLISLGMKVGPALAAGNTVVVKPSEMTPFAPDLFARLCSEAGIPDGVVNMLPGAIEAGEALVRHPKVEKISFTGGPIAARKILVACAEQLKPTVFELGGKSASLVFPDVDLDKVCTDAVVRSIGILSGQGCALPTRLLVHAQVYDKVLQLLAEKVKLLKVGDPFDPTTIVGPLINGTACDRVMAMIERATRAGAGRLLCGGKRAQTGQGGYFIEPTIFVDANPDSEISQIEVFGPVLVVSEFNTEEEAIALANKTAYGLSAYIQTHDVKRVHRLAERLKSGTVYVNGASSIKPDTPFGGIGVSGYGREGGRAGLDEFLRLKTIAIG